MILQKSWQPRPRLGKSISLLITRPELKSSRVPTAVPTGTIKPADPSSAHEQIVTPWDVQGSVSSDGQQLAIDYDKLIDQFGTRRVDAALLERFERITGNKPHVFLRRGMFFSHRRVSHRILT